MSIELRKEDFIKKAVVKHGDRFNYGGVDYKSNKKLVTIKCNKHDLVFNQTPSNHLNGYGGCVVCKQELVTKSPTEYIKEVSQIHDNFYIYDKTLYTKAFDSVIITCPIHGDFKQVAKDHYKNGCTSCGINKRTDLLRYNIEKFKEKAQEVHGNIYDYSLSVYKNSNSIVKIICPLHGIFELKACRHTNKMGQGCQKCGMQSRTDFSTYTNDKFLQLLFKIHSVEGIKPLENYTKSNKHLLVDTKYGVCSITPNSLLGGTFPTIMSAINKNEYCINQFKEIHGDKYDYSLVNYINSIKKVEISCKLHGIFKQSPVSHMGGRGCSICGYIGNGGYSRSDFIKIANGRPGTLYLLFWKNEKQECFYKIGITSVGVKKRFERGCNIPYSYEIVNEYICDAGCVWDLEKQLHKKYKPYQYLPQNKFQGYTECFNTGLPIDEIISYLNSL